MLLKNPESADGNTCFLSSSNVVVLSFDPDSNAISVTPTLFSPGSAKMSLFYKEWVNAVET